MFFSDIISEKVSSGEWIGIGFYVDFSFVDGDETEWNIKIFDDDDKKESEIKIPWVSNKEHVVNLLSNKIYQWFKGFTQVNAEAEDKMPFIPEGLWYFEADKYLIVEDLLTFIENEEIELSEKESFFDSINYRSSIDQIRRSAILVS